jgi:hypothetical protein
LRAELSNISMYELPSVKHRMNIVLADIKPSYLYLRSDEFSLQTSAVELNISLMGIVSAKMLLDIEKFFELKKPTGERWKLWTTVRKPLPLLVPN